VLEGLSQGRGGWIVTQNLDMLRRTLSSDSFRELIRGADLVVPDGMPLVWASRLARLPGGPLPERVAGSSLLLSLSRAAGDAGHSVFLLGGAPGAAEGAASALRRSCPGLRIAGALCPPFGFERDPHFMRDIEGALIRAQPDIVYVALGSPKQEVLIDQLRRSPQLEAWAASAWWIGVGISLSFASGQVRRAPRWMQSAGLEWLHRLAQEPRRLARRYLIDGLPFACRLLAAAAARRVHRPVGAS